METRTSRDLLIISDLHLGEGLGRETVESTRLEGELVAFLDHHRAEPRPWRLVINGDMVDFVCTTVMPAEVGFAGELHPDDHTYGLGGVEAAARIKLAKVVAHHSAVVRALGRFVGSGHELAIVVGNHDAEMHWPSVQEILREAIVAAWAEQVPATDPRTLDDMRAAIQFHEWFLMEDGVAWIEHGHQYDPYCSFEHALEPAQDDREIDPNVGALLLRYVTHRFAGDMHHAWGFTFFGYLRMWFAQGRNRAFAIGSGYYDMCRRLVEHWRRRVPERIASHQQRARARVAAVARRARLSEDRLHELASLWRPPVVTDLGRLVRALMLDRLSLVLLGPVLAGLPVLLLPAGWQILGATVLAFPLAAWFRMALASREPSDPRSAMLTSAHAIRRIAGVPIVVMGHSHDPCAEQDAEGWYFNTGTWVPHQDPKKAFTHVRIERTAAGVRAMLCQWRDGASRAWVPHAA